MSLVTKFLRHELISGSFYMFVGGMIANLAAFLVNLFYARNLSYSDYGIFASLLSLITLASIPAGSLNTIIVKFATGLFVKKDIQGLKMLYVMFFKLILVFSILFIFIFSVLSGYFSSFLKLNSFFYIFLTSLAIIFFYFNALNTSFLQSELKFGFISFLSGFGGLIKLLAGLVLVILGFNAFSGIWAIVLMGVGMFALAFIPLNKIFIKSGSKNLPELNLKKITVYAIPTFLTVLFMTSFTSSDVILVKHFFNASDAGFYAGLSLVGKVIFYFTGIIPIVMFPLLVKRHSTGKGFINTFILSIILVTLPSLAITTLYYLYPQFMINLFLGGRDYIVLTKYLGYFGLFLTVFSVINLFVSFFLSLGNTKIVYPVVVAALAQIGLIYLYHGSFFDVINVSFGVCLVLLVFLFAIFIKQYAHTVKLKETISALNSSPV